jgi:L-lactate dehydrogenase (cytochrome)
MNGLSLPPRLTPRGFLGFAARPRWSLSALFGRRFDFVNVAHRVDAMSAGPTSLQAYINNQFDRSLTWKDVEWLAARWQGPLAVKGLLRPEDARTACEAGADTVMISVHGGRQLDSSVAPIDQIAPVADAVAGRMKIICDGGIRRGSHIVKSLALGADACAIGRPYLYGLAAGGTEGVSSALSILFDEYDRSMALAGARRPCDLDRSFIRHRTGSQPSTVQQEVERTG